MQVSIGGDRLGSGNKEKVNLRTYNRSTHDLSYAWRSSMASGTLVPFMVKVALPGDIFDIKLNAEILTLPTVGPVFGSYKVQLDVFQVPIRLYNARLHMNELGIGLNMSEVKLPLAELRASWDISTQSIKENLDREQVGSSALWRYLGVSGLGNGRDSSGPIQRYVNAVPFLAYYDIYKNYYANKQEENAYVLHVDADNIDEPIKDVSISGPLSFGTRTSIYQLENDLIIGGNLVSDLWVVMGPGKDQIDPASVTIRFDGLEQPLTDIFDTFSWDEASGILKATEPSFNGADPSTWNCFDDTASISDPAGAKSARVYPFPLKNIDDMRKSILRHPDDTVPFILDGNSPRPYQLHRKLIPTTTNYALSYIQEGLAVKTYQSDQFQNWINTDWIDGPDGINEITSVDTTGDSFTIDSLNLAKKVYVMLNRIAISGGSYDDWLNAVYTHERARGTESPMYLGSLIKELSFQEVVSSAEASDLPLGTLGGRGRMTDKNKGGYVKAKVDEPSYLMGIVSITPRIDYAQGNKWDINLLTLDDLHKPALDAIGYQDLVTDWLSWRDTEVNNSDVTAFKSVGKQPAWLNYMTSVNRSFGNFIDKEAFMVLNRQYEYDSTGVTDLTTYVDPAKFNVIFAKTDVSSMNFWTQIYCDIKARRKMSAKVIPNL